MGYKRVVMREYGGPDVLEVVEEPSLPEPGHGEVRTRVVATGAAFTDVMIRKGMYPDVKQKPPFSPGYDFVGVVDKLGPGVTRWKEGDRVADLTVIGSYSEYLCRPASRLTRVPEAIDDAEAVSVVLAYVTAHQMLHRAARVSKGQRILVHGAGGAVGTAMLQLGRLLDLEMYGTASGAKQEVVTRLGAVAIDYERENWSERSRELCPDGFDAVFDPIGGSHFKESLRLVKRGGLLVAFGFYNAVTGKGGGIIGDFLRLKFWNLLPNGKRTAFYSIGALRESRPDWFSEDLSALFELLANGEIRPVIGATMPLVEAERAHRMIEAAEIEGKIVLTVP